MPITKSAKKALRQNLRRRTRNLIYKKKMARLLKEFKKVESLGKKEEIQKLLPKIYKALDKAVKVGVIKERAAARKKSRMTKLRKKV